MPLIEWQEHFRTGVDSVDFEHQEMIALLNELYEGLEGSAGREDILGFFGEVYTRISAHFALEERVMKDHGYDQYETHKAEHETLLDDIREIMDDYEDGLLEGSIEQLGQRLEAWFGDHFRNHDARLHAVFAGRNVDLGEI